MNADTLESKALATIALNRAKHKAEGKNFRLQIELANARTGAYSKTIVFYCVAEPTPQRIGALVLRNRGSISASTSRVEAL